MKKLTYQEEARIKEHFLTYLGNFIKTKRNKKNISQVTLANCLNITDSALSKYESGTRDMPVSYLPLISTYCDFSLTEYSALNFGTFSWFSIVVVSPNSSSTSSVIVTVS